jgi:hypothetical protein
MEPVRPQRQSAQQALRLARERPLVQLVQQQPEQLRLPPLPL